MTRPTRPDCGDCGAVVGEAHSDGCDVARCLATGLQRIACEHPHDCGEDVWTGVWPGTEDAERLGWFSYWNDSMCRWVRCGADHPGAGPDLNALAVNARWNPALQRWESCAR